jgi:hypothetical protein
MKSTISSNDWELTSVADHETKRLRERAIPYGSYSEGAAVRVLITLGFVLLCGFSLLVAFLVVKG